MALRQATLCFLFDGKNNKILLGMKKIGFGSGKYNGFGGKVEQNENVVSATAREMQEESGVLVDSNDLVHHAIIDFFFPHKPEWNQQVHAFVAYNWKGTPQESNEMKPIWFSTKELPFDLMWVDDKYWLPLVLENKKVKASFTFGEKDGEILKKEIKTVNSL